MEFIKSAFSWRGDKSCHRLMFLIVAVLGLLNVFWGEKIPAGGGFGYDGVFYADMVRNLDTIISGGQLSSYYAQRILPSAIVRSLLLFSGAPISDSNIIRGFELYNLVLLGGACWVWRRVADHFSLSVAGRWMGFGGIFINFESSKQAFYYPVLTDVTALLVAMLLLLFFIEKKPIALFLTTVIGAFCWPAVSVCGAFLLMFLNSELPTGIIAPASSTGTAATLNIPGLVRTSGIAVLILSIIGYILLVWVIPGGGYVGSELKVLLTPKSIKRFEALFTSLPSLFGLLIALVMLVGSISFFPALLASLRRIRLPLLVLGLAAVIIPSYIIKAISNPGIATPNSLQSVLRAIYLADEGRQGKFLLPVVTLASFWGPLIVVLLLYWKAFCVEARKLGPGVVAVIGINLLLGMIGEPRFITIAWPFFVLGIVLAFEAATTRPSFKYVLTALTLVYAQFWMKLNLAPWMPPDKEGVLAFPKQIFFMHYGLSMSWWSYFIQLIVVVLSAIWLQKNVIAVGLTESKWMKKEPEGVGEVENEYR